ncbi:CLUMA_CG017492, isoform A [Clunio marinus]|uniref:CLUMA_CG017492, isoform A n=1 Tax=Clunio marinus TaxID=568069 RepID=A0A1J1IZ14_9DIPT|nr:CLUMA_CG017492, isoform A [Clunio marinus]
MITDKDLRMVEASPIAVKLLWQIHSLHDSDEIKIFLKFIFVNIVKLTMTFKFFTHCCHFVHLLSYFASALLVTFDLFIHVKFYAFYVILKAELGISHEAKRQPVRVKNKNNSL